MPGRVMRPLISSRLSAGGRIQSEEMETVSRTRIVATRRIVLPERRPTAFGLPADFLFDLNGRVLAGKYGQHADDQWSVEEVIALARSTASSPSQS